MAVEPGGSCVRAIYIARQAGAAMDALPQVRAVASAGLEGDHHFAASGAADERRPDREVTLIEEEALDALRRDYAIELGPGESRRNIVTRGVALNHLVGRRFVVGQATLEGMRLCEPCGHLEKLTRPGVQKGLIHRGGLRARIVADGTIRVGDRVGGLYP